MKLRFQQPLMIIITFLVVIAFVWLYNSNSRVDHVGTDRIGSIYGRDITRTEFVRNARKFEIASSLGMYDMLQDLVGQARTPDQAAENFVWNSMVLRHEADKMGIQPTDAEVEEFVKTMPVFQVGGKYDSTRFVAFVQNALSPRGFTEEHFFDLVRDNLKVDKIKKLVSSTTEPVPSEIRAIYEQRHQKTDASVIRLKLEDRG